MSKDSTSRDDQSLIEM